MFYLISYNCDDLIRTCSIKYIMRQERLLFGIDIKYKNNKRLVRLDLIALRVTSNIIDLSHKEFMRCKLLIDDRSK